MAHYYIDEHPLYRGDTAETIYMSMDDNPDKKLQLLTYHRNDKNVVLRYNETNICGRFNIPTYYTDMARNFKITAVNKTLDDDDDDDTDVWGVELKAHGYNGTRLLKINNVSQSEVQFDLCIFLLNAYFDSDSFWFIFDNDKFSYTIEYEGYMLNKKDRDNSTRQQDRFVYKTKYIHDALLSVNNYTLDYIYDGALMNRFHDDDSKYTIDLSPPTQMKRAKGSSINNYD